MTFAPVVPWWLWVVLSAAGLGAATVLARRSRPNARGRAVRRLGIAVTLSFLGLHPGFGSIAGDTGRTDLDVVVVVDRTTSMDALDWNGAKPRLAGVRSDVRDIARALAGSRFTLISFGHRPQLELPFTTDTGALLAATDALQRESPLEGSGSRISTPVGEARRALDRAKEQNPERRRILFVLTDGEVTEGSDSAQPWASLSGSVDGGAVVGYGTTTGGRMRLTEDGSIDGWIVDRFGVEARSKIGTALLEGIADALGVGYVHSTTPHEVRSVLERIDPSYAAGGDGTARIDPSWVLGLALLALLLPEVRESVRDLRRLRREAT